MTETVYFLEGQDQAGFWRLVESFLSYPPDESDLAYAKKDVNYEVYRLVKHFRSQETIWESK